MQDKDLAFYEKAVSWAKKRGYSKLKAVKIEELEDPFAFISKEKEQEFRPDITAVRNGKKTYFEIALKSDDKKAVVNKWKLLDQMAKIKSGNFILFTPSGHKAFADRIIKKHNIEATLVNI